MQTPALTLSERQRSTLRTGLVAGTLASFASTAALMLCGRREAGSLVAPTNATSHWLWGDRAFDVRGPTLKHTALGYATHHASAIFWALIYGWLHASRHPRSRLPRRSRAPAPPPRWPARWTTRSRRTGSGRASSTTFRSAPWGRSTASLPWGWRPAACWPSAATRTSSAPCYAQHE